MDTEKCRIGGYTVYIVNMMVIQHKECYFPLKLRDFGFLAKKFFSAKAVIRCHCDDLKQDIPAENLWFC